MLREYSPPITCHLLHIMCHVSHVQCHVLHVMCSMSQYFFLSFLDKVVKLVGGGFVINGPYPV